MLFLTRRQLFELLVEAPACLFTVADKNLTSSVPAPLVHHTTDHNSECILGCLERNPGNGCPLCRHKITSKDLRAGKTPSDLEREAARAAAEAEGRDLDAEEAKADEDKVADSKLQVCLHYCCYEAE
jgi:hypothetical protein